MPPASDQPSPDGRRLVLTDAARGLRRQLGPTAWTVFEELLLEAVGDQSMVVETSVRRIAAGVGVSKDSAARALRRLIADGVVSRRGGRDAATGCFGRSVYELRRDALTGVVVVAEYDAATRAQVKSHRRERRRAGPAEDRQFSLFDLPAGSDP